MTVLTFFENILEQPLIFKCNKNPKKSGTVMLEFKMQDDGSLQCFEIRPCNNGGPCKACEKCVESVYRRIVK